MFSLCNLLSFTAVVINLIVAANSQYVYSYYSSIGTETPHPLDPLSALEIRLAAAVVRQYNHTSAWQFKYIALHEPDKTLLYPYLLALTTPPANLVPRRADVLINCPITRIPIWVIVNLKDYRVESWEESPGDAVASITTEDNDIASNVALNDPNVLQRLRAVGYNGSNDVIPIVWDAGYVADNPVYSQARKLVQVFFGGAKLGSDSNYYGHPFDFVVYVELGPNIVRGIESFHIHQGFDRRDRSGNTIPQREYNLFSDQRPVRKTLNPLKISQPSGPSFKITGHAITWDNFVLRIGYNPREGPHIYTVGFIDHGVVRPIVYRMSIVEAVLQYGDPRPPFHRKTSFDMSAWEFGGSIVTLPVHQFCRGDAQYLSLPHHNEKGESWVTDSEVCVVEEDAGVLWTYRDSSTDKIEVIRAQRLSVNYYINIGNDNFFISWRFYQDATIELALKVTGLHSNDLMAVDVKAPPYGNLLGPQLYSQIYQEWFAVRLDLDIDGRENIVATEDIVSVSDRRTPQNPYGNGMTVATNVLKTVGEATTDILPTRTWAVSNTRRLNGITGKPVAWKLLPEGNNNPPNLLTKDSPLRAAIPWTEHNMWVLPYNPDQILVGGRYKSDGVATWTQQNASASLVNQDIVLWHVFNFVEESSTDTWPMFSDCPGTIGFRLRPQGFFSASPLIQASGAADMTALDGRENEHSCSATSTSSSIFSSYYFPSG